MKRTGVLIISAILSLIIAANAAAIVTIVEETDAGTRVAANGRIAAFLQENGLDGRYVEDIDSLEAMHAIRSVVAEIGKDEDLEHELNTLVANELWAAQRAGLDPVYMFVGSSWWRMTLPTDEDAEEVEYPVPTR